ncbi:MAG TPA: hypothetical protein P5080_05865 [Candidatus Paceibacterota bacterium]|nr:hypothetical protein [Candidatus Pacearchaeota archaeon]HRZ51465.1 hypothetical protein [Candidatus Paceibacterota bacterium]HSA37193.1 hypothetical protein [Candidatus Paceibacterota bacterium]
MKEVMDLTDFYKGKPVPMMLVKLGLKKELQAYAIILDEQLGLPADMPITEKMMLDVIKAHQLGDEGEMRQQIGRLRFDAIVAKFQERLQALGIMFGITPEQAKKAAFGMDLDKEDLGEKIFALFGNKKVPVPAQLVKTGFQGEIKAYTIILNDQLGLPADMPITEKMMLAAIQAHLLSGRNRTEMKEAIGPARFEGIIKKFEERERAHEIMFGITPGQVREVVLKMRP